jgi:hypothetical protein
MTVTREELYADVWKEPLTKVAKWYGVSSNYLARVCEELKVPVPPRGYWQRRAVGREAPIPALPELDPGDDTEWGRGAEARNRRPPAPVFTPITVRRSRRRPKPKMHPILVDARADFMDSKERRIYEYDDGFLTPKKATLPDIFVSREALDSALALANKLHLALEDHGYWVRLAPYAVNYRPGDIRHRDGDRRLWALARGSQIWQPSQRTLVFVGGVAIGLSVFEIAAEAKVVVEGGKCVRVSPLRVDDSPVDLWSPRIHDLPMPTGRFAVHAFSPYGVDWERCWYETKRGGLRRLFGEIATELERAAPELVRLYDEASVRAEESYRKWEAERREEERRERQQELEKAKEAHRKRLRASIDEWRMARDIRAYVDEVRAALAREELAIAGGGGVGDDLEEALAFADEIDPMTSWRKGKSPAGWETAVENGVDATESESSTDSEP